MNPRRTLIYPIKNDASNTLNITVIHMNKIWTRSNSNSSGPSTLFTTKLKHFISEFWTSGAVTCY